VCEHDSDLAMSEHDPVEVRCRDTEFDPPSVSLSDTAVQPGTRLRRRRPVAGRGRL